MRVVVAQEHSGQAEWIRKILLGLGLECEAQDCVPFPQLPVRLAQGSPDLVLVQMGSNSQKAFDSIHQAMTQTSSPIFAVGLMTDAQQIVQAQRHGARQYLDEARLKPELETALENLRVSGAIRQFQRAHCRASCRQRRAAGSRPWRRISPSPGPADIRAGCFAGAGAGAGRIGSEPGSGPAAYDR